MQMLLCRRYGDKTSRFHHSPNLLRRPEIRQINGMGLREILVIEPVWRFSRIKAVKHETAARAEDAEHLSQHGFLAPHVMEGVLTGYEIKAASAKRQHRSISLHPGDIRSFGLRLPQHSQ